MTDYLFRPSTVQPGALTALAISSFAGGLKDGFKGETNSQENSLKARMPVSAMIPAFAYATLPKEVAAMIREDRRMIENVSAKSRNAGIACATVIKRAFGF